VCVCVFVIFVLVLSLFNLSCQRRMLAMHGFGYRRFSRQSLAHGDHGLCRIRKRLGCILASIMAATALALGIDSTFISSGTLSSSDERRTPRIKRRAASTTAVLSATASPADLRSEFEEIGDFSGDGSAFALKPGAVPLTPPNGDPVRYDIDAFSPGFVIDKVLSPEACRKLVALSEASGFRNRWSANLGVTTLYLDEEFERQLFERLKPFLPNSLGGEPIGINRRWAVIKYGPGQYMNTHIDGHVPGTTRKGDKMEYETGTRSYMTALFWLADDVVGGETVFTFPQGGTWVKIPPKEGAALFFNHGQNAVSNPYHHGGSVESGLKYLVRADVIYASNGH